MALEIGTHTANSIFPGSRDRGVARAPELKLFHRHELMSAVGAESGSRPPKSERPWSSAY
jgi:hypothetical protein